MVYRQALITGGAGFIGSHLADALIRKSVKVIVIDNLSAGTMDNISHLLHHPSFRFIRGDLVHLEDIQHAIDCCDIVFHLSGNSDVRKGFSNPKADFDDNIVATYNLLEAMRRSRSCKKIIFTSTSTVYGEATQIPTPEDYSPLQPISLYGASKLACESLISGYSDMFNFRSVILRLANIVGPRSTHGVVSDFVKKLNHNPRVLDVLGDGKQCKSYLYVDDCISALLLGSEFNHNGRVHICNVGSEDRISVLSIAQIVVEEMGLKNVEIRCNPAIEDGRGWVGDVKDMLLDISKLKQLGWNPKADSSMAVRMTARSLSDRSISVDIPKQTKPIESRRDSIP